MPSFPSPILSVQSGLCWTWEIKNDCMCPSPGVAPASQIQPIHIILPDLLLLPGLFLLSLWHPYSSVFQTRNLHVLIPLLSPLGLIGPHRTFLSTILFYFSSFVLHTSFWIFVSYLFSSSPILSSAMHFKTAVKPIHLVFLKKNQLYQLFYFSILFKFWRSFRSIFQSSAKFSLLSLSSLSTVILDPVSFHLSI